MIERRNMNETQMLFEWMYFCVFAYSFLSDCKCSVDKIEHCSGEFAIGVNFIDICGCDSGW